MQANMSPVRWACDVQSACGVWEARGSPNGCVVRLLRASQDYFASPTKKPRLAASLPLVIHHNSLIPHSISEQLTTKNQIVEAVVPVCGAHVSFGDVPFAQSVLLVSVTTRGTQESDTVYVLVRLRLGDVSGLASSPTFEVIDSFTQNALGSLSRVCILDNMVAGARLPIIHFHCIGPSDASDNHTAPQAGQCSTPLPILKSSSLPLLCFTEEEVLRCYQVSRDTPNNNDEERRGISIAQHACHGEQQPSSWGWHAMPPEEEHWLNNVDVRFWQEAETAVVFQGDDLNFSHMFIATSSTHTLNTDYSTVTIKQNAQRSLVHVSQNGSSSMVFTGVTELPSAGVVEEMVVGDCAGTGQPWVALRCTDPPSIIVLASEGPSGAMKVVHTHAGVAKFVGVCDALGRGFDQIVFVEDRSRKTRFHIISCLGITSCAELQFVMPPQLLVATEASAMCAGRRRGSKALLGDHTTTGVGDVDQSVGDTGTKGRSSKLRSNKRRGGDNRTGNNSSSRDDAHDLALKKVKSAGDSGEGEEEGRTDILAPKDRAENALGAIAGFLRAQVTQGNELATNRLGRELQDKTNLTRALQLRVSALSSVRRNSSGAAVGADQVRLVCVFVWC
jgi:hypothetical protein